MNSLETLLPCREAVACKEVVACKEADESEMAFLLRRALAAATGEPDWRAEGRLDSSGIFESSGSLPENHEIEPLLFKQSSKSTHFMVYSRQNWKEFSIVNFRKHLFL